MDCFGKKQQQQHKTLVWCEHSQYIPLILMLVTRWACTVQQLMFHRNGAVFAFPHRQVALCLDCLSMWMAAGEFMQHNLRSSRSSTKHENQWPVRTSQKINNQKSDWIYSNVFLPSKLICEASGEIYSRNTCETDRQTDHLAYIHTVHAYALRTRFKVSDCSAA